MGCFFAFFSEEFGAVEAKADARSIAVAGEDEVAITGLDGEVVAAEFVGANDFLERGVVKVFDVGLARDFHGIDFIGVRGDIEVDSLHVIKSGRLSEELFRKGAAPAAVIAAFSSERGFNARRCHEGFSEDGSKRGCFSGAILCPPGGKGGVVMEENGVVGHVDRSLDVMFGKHGHALIADFGCLDVPS